jgi:hypothetical protein
MNTLTLREKLLRSVSAEELTALCYDHFRPVYEQFVPGMSRPERIQRLIEHVERRGEIERLTKMLNSYNYDEALSEARLDLDEARARLQVLRELERAMGERLPYEVRIRLLAARRAVQAAHDRVLILKSSRYCM